MRAALGLGENQTAIGLVGRFDAVKGQKKLLEAFARLAGSNLRLVLAGFDTASCGGEDLRALARELGVEKKILFPGRVDDIRALMNALDIGVVASIGSETIARVALEMMACGVPLISTRVGVMPDLLEAEALVPPGDAAAMSALLQRCVADKPFMAGMKKTQASRMQSLRETDFCEQTLAVYREAFARRRDFMRTRPVTSLPPLKSTPRL
ncbi:hypothetical protein FACS1894168_4140 [Deltaproteobacteria bacterium]|nr:hypothetical protein FACS1894168_4140 [Deltaproteobacteria bacterium]